MKISKLQYITQEEGPKTHAQMAEAACRAGVRWVQLRMKDKTYEQAVQLATHTRKICEEHGAVFIVNDNVEIARTVEADGVHLGKEDMPPDEARKILGNGKIIGGTANTLEDIRRLAGMGVDYIGLGPLRFTTTKQKLSPVLGLQGYQTLLAQCRAENILIPIVAIGGVVSEDVSSLLATGVHGIALSGVLGRSDNKKELVTLLNSYLGE
jgi:thiamine-phosphate pyrophosphorylase